MLSTTPTPQNRASRACVRGLKTRVWGFCRRPATRAPVFGLQTTKPRRVAKAAAAKIASGPSLWPSRDPIQERGGLNLYSFVLNNPLRFYDYLGLDPKESNGFTPSSESGIVNCAGYAGSGGQQYVYRAPSERGVTGRSMMDDMEAEGWACSLMTGPTCEAPCEFEKMVITNWRTGNDANRDENGRMRDSFTEDDIQFGQGASGGLTDYHAIYSPSGCSPTYSQILGRLPAGTAPEPDIIPADFSGKQYCCKRKKK
jgi:hypothetical protein